MALRYLPLLVVVVLLLVVVSRGRRQQRDTLDLQSTLSAGDRVVTSSGLHGTVVELGNDTVVLEASPGVLLTWARRAVVRRVSDSATTSHPSTPAPPLTPAAPTAPPPVPASDRAEPGAVERGER